MSDLTNQMRGTLQLMAQSCVAPTVLWNDHANAVLEAATEIERLEASNEELIRGMTEMAERFTARMDAVGHGTT